MVELFANPSHSAAQPAEGKIPLAKVTTQADGSWQWIGFAPYLSWVTATLTKNGDTSEFSAPVQQLQTALVTFSGKVCRGTDCSKLSAVMVTLFKRKGDSWVEANRTRTDSEGRFTLPVALSELPGEYWLMVADSRYRVTRATSASGGAVGDDGSIQFSISTPGEYGGNELFLSLVGWVFRGQVEASAEPGRALPLPVEVSLYGATAESDLGRKLAGVRTREDGTFELQYAPPGGEGFAYYTLAIKDPAYRILQATPGRGGRLTPEQYIRFDHLPPGDSEENLFIVGSLWTAMTKPTVAAFEVISPTGLIAVLPPRDFVIEGIEVTQAIQCFVDPSSAIGSAECPMDNALPLVGGKLAAVRVYVTVNETCWAPNDAGSVSVDLHVSWGIQGSVQRAIHKAQCAPSTWRRANAAGTANFFLMVPDA